MDNQSDHDKLIQLETKISLMCKDMSEIKSINKEILNKIENQSREIANNIIKSQDDCNVCKSEIYNEIKEKPDFGTFKWVTGGLAGLILLAITWVGMMSFENKIGIEKVNMSIQQHIKWGEEENKKINESIESLEDHNHIADPQN